jgi:hypothetical protein
MFGLKVRQRAFVTLQRTAHIVVIPVTISHTQLKVNRLCGLDILKRPIITIIIIHFPLDLYRCGISHIVHKCAEHLSQYTLHVTQ